MFARSISCLPEVLPEVLRVCPKYIVLARSLARSTTCLPEVYRVCPKSCPKYIVFARSLARSTTCMPEVKCDCPKSCPKYYVFAHVEMPAPIPPSGPPRSRRRAKKHDSPCLLPFFFFQMRCDVTIRYQNEVWYYCNEIVQKKWLFFFSGRTWVLSRPSMFLRKTAPSPRLTACVGSINMG